MDGLRTCARENVLKPAPPIERDDPKVWVRGSLMMVVVVVKVMVVMAVVVVVKCVRGTNGNNLGFGMFALL